MRCQLHHRRSNFRQLLGSNLGCLDARILRWAYGDDFARVAASISRKAPDGTLTDGTYGRYVQAERKILTGVPYYDPDDPDFGWGEVDMGPGKGGLHS